MRHILLIIFFQIFFCPLFADILIFKNCKSEDYTFQKNKYTLDLNQRMMIREFIYDEVSFRKLRLNDITAKKENITSKGIEEEDNLIVSEISGYPSFYTQMIFDKKDRSIKIKTVLNGTEGVSLVSICEDVISFKKES
jgi:hypothetical protein|tara:strand:- start:1026 stop:1439 length:414 start_codon:yes stop_codon:yes gene_type:complete